MSYEKKRKKCELILTELEQVKSGSRAAPSTDRLFHSSIMLGKNEDFLRATELQDSTRQVSGGESQELLHLGTVLGHVYSSTLAQWETAGPEIQRLIVRYPSEAQEKLEVSLSQK